MRMGEATQKLKGILDGRGVKQYLKGYDHLTYCDFGGHLASIFETSKGKMVLHVTFDRAEDAAEAVIGAGEHQSNRALKDEIAWLHAELHGVELEAEKARDEAAENKWARDLLNRIAERIRLANASSLRDYVSGIETENTRLRSCLEDAAENERLTAHEFDQLKEERDRLRGMLGCPLLNDGKRARQNGKRLPCEHLMERNTELRELVRDIWNQARLCDANMHIEGMRLTEQAREE